MPSLPRLARRYGNAVFDNARWAAFRPRAGDVVVIAPPKCGTTWTTKLSAMLDHVANTRDSRQSGVAPGARLDPNALFRRWATEGQFPWMFDGAPFQSVVWFTASWWIHGGLPNLHLTHYRDLTLDLVGEMRRLAAFLGREVDEPRWPAFLAAASFVEMKAAADDNAPSSARGVWLSNSDFFREGRLDAGRDVLSPENQALYDAVNKPRLPADLKAWMEGGRRAAEP